jgi:presenilin-like A22 family membrane protease
MKIQPSLFLKEALLFGSTLALGLFVAYRYLLLSSASEIVQPSSFSSGDFVGFIVVVGMVWFASRVPRLAHWVFWIFLSLVVLSGSQVVIASVAPFPWDIAGGLAILTVFLLARNVLVHDLAIIIAIAGIGSVVGIMITPTVGILAFALLSFYDIIAVYKTRHMIRVAESMIRSGAIFGFIVPVRFKLFLASRREARARVGSDFMVLGSGDIGLPVIFVSSLIRQSVPEALIVAGFVMLGLLLTHILFVSQETRRPMAALPPIATMTMIGYVVALLII